MKSSHTKVEWRIGSEVKKVSCPLDIVEYQKYMGGVDRGDQHQVMSADFTGFANFTHS